MATPAGATLIQTELRGGVLLAVIDMPGRTMNVFSAGLMDAVEALVIRLETDDAVKALVLTSGKDSFLAGADLDMVRGYTRAGLTASRDHLHAMCGRLGRLFVRLEASEKPTVAAINGLALGGGLEVTMACRRRLVADDPRLQLGLPEVKLGLLPGAGGTQRLPRLIGVDCGLDLLLSGKSVSTTEAKTLGLVDEIVAPAQLVARAIEVARGLIGRPVLRRPATLAPGRYDFAAPDAAQRIVRAHGFGEDMTARYPAYIAIARAVADGANQPIDRGTEIEMDRFVDLMQSPVAGNMVTVLFLERQRADKQALLFGGLKGARFAVDGGGAAADALRAALVVGKAALIAPDEASAGDVVVAADPTAGDLTLLDGVTAATARIGITLRRSKAYGAALEIAGAAAGVPIDKALALARQLRATPFIHGGRRSMLATLGEAGDRARAAGLPEDAVVAALARAAARLAASEDVGDRDLADVACVVGGVFPAFAGGPFAFLRAGAAQGFA